MSTSTFERKPPIKLAELSSLSAGDIATVNEVLARLKHLPGALLPILHGIQDALGYVPKDAVPVVAKSLNLSRAEVHGVVSFYHWYRTEKPGEHVIHLCRAEACQSCGSEELLAQTEALLGCKLHETSADGRFSLEPVYCLGLCASSPAMTVNEQVHGRVGVEKFDRLLATARSAA